MKTKGLILMIVFLTVSVPFPSSASVSPDARLRQLCGRCHALRIDRDCVAGDCGVDETKIARNKNWPQMIGWVRTLLGCRMEDADQDLLASYLTQRYPSSVPADLWKEAGPVGQGWNVVSLLQHGPFLYAGMEGSGRIYRSLDGKAWREVANTHQLAVYGLTPFHDRLYAGTDNPGAEVWESETGADWRRVAAFPADQTGIISMGVFKDSLYAGTANGKVFRSVDGRAWKEAGHLEDGPQWVRFLVEFKNALYAGTQHGRLFRSPDGTRWEEVGGPIRKGRSESAFRGVAVFQDELYVGTLLGGEIWRSKTGREWERVYAFAPGTDRGYVASMISYREYLYAGITGGFGSGSVLRSRDGIHWEETGTISPHTIEALSPFKGRLYAAALIPPQARIFFFRGP